MKTKVVKAKGVKRKLPKKKALSKKEKEINQLAQVFNNKQDDLIIEHKQINQKKKKTKDDFARILEIEEELDSFKTVTDEVYVENYFPLENPDLSNGSGIVGRVVSKLHRTDDVATDIWSNFVSVISENYQLANLRNKEDIKRFIFDRFVKNYKIDEMSERVADIVLSRRQKGIQINEN